MVISNYNLLKSLLYVRFSEQLIQYTFDFNKIMFTVADLDGIK